MSDLIIFKNMHVFILVGIIKDRNSPVGVKTIGQVARPKEIGINKAAGDNSGEVVGRDTAKAHTIRQDTINMDTATVIGIAGINSITTTSIGVNNNRVDRVLLQLAAKL